MATDRREKKRYAHQTMTSRPCNGSVQVLATIVRGWSRPARPAPSVRPGPVPPDRYRGGRERAGRSRSEEGDSHRGHQIAEGLRGQLDRVVRGIPAAPTSQRPNGVV